MRTKIRQAFFFGRFASFLPLPSAEQYPLSSKMRYFAPFLVVLALTVACAFAQPTADRVTSLPNLVRPPLAAARLYTERPFCKPV